MMRDDIPPVAPTPTLSGLESRTGFATLAEALDYAAGGTAGYNFYSGRLDLVESLPYSVLRVEARELAGKLLGAGLAPGDRVALVAETDGDFIRAFAACQYAGLVPAPLPLPLAFGDRAAYVHQIRRMIAGARASAALAPAWATEWLEEAASGLALKVCGTVADLRARPISAPLPELDPTGLSYLQFSSGSTRAPAGIAITHHALMNNTAAIIAHGLAIHAGDRGVSWLPFYHDMGLVGFVLAPLVAQMSVDYLATRDFARRPLGWLTLMERNGATVSFSPSFGYELCAKRASTGAAPRLDLSRWRVAGIGGDMIRPHVLDGFASVFTPMGFDRSAFVPSYGMAETTLAVTFRPLNRGAELDRVDLDLLERHGIVASPRGERFRDFVKCGRVLPGHELQVRDGEGLNLPERRLGRVFVKGPSLMRGYDHKPEETAMVLSPDGWLDTGDLGYLADGELVVTGRSKDVILINGRNVWPQDLELTAEQVDGVRHGDVAAFAIDGGEAEGVVVLVQCRSGEPALRHALAQAIGAAVRRGHGIEPLVVLVPNNALPMTSSGKLSRTAARRAYVAGEYA